MAFFGKLTARLSATREGNWLARQFGFALADVYHDQPRMSRLRPPFQMFRKGPIHAFWVSGYFVLRDLEEHGIERLVLPDPEAPAVKTMIETAGRSFDYVKRILHATRLAKNMNIDVRWYRDFVGVALTLGPDWGLIEPKIPYGKVGERPIIRIRGRGNRKVLDRYRATFHRLWDASNAPDMETIESTRVPPAMSSRLTPLERVKSPMPVDLKLAREMMPDLPEDAVVLLRSLLDRPRRVHESEYMALDLLRDVDVVWSKPYRGDRRRNTYRPKIGVAEVVTELGL